MVSAIQNNEGTARVGIIAGRGDLPLALASSLRANGRDPFVILVEGEADPTRYSEFPFETAAITKIGKFLKILKRENCTQITLAGPINRPDFKSIVPDFEGVKLLARITGALSKGDDGLLNAITNFLSEKGFQVLGTHELASDLLVQSGQMGVVAAGEQDLEDIEEGTRIVKAIGKLDIGQAAVIRDGYVLAVEAAEGTDKLLKRVAEFARDKPGGVLVKLTKPGQDLRVDLPTIGAETVALAAEANLSGIAVEAGLTLVLEKSEMVRRADAAGLFLIGLDPDQQSK
ncbi:MAG: UDP-2,3-diacylglucosamine diphosphatase LpxI [Proteobacteria bacterium]|nr:UDP-2,3-diacylglucosamine diphosphatase LpxI [Pseudomonadota bacterium]